VDIDTEWSIAAWFSSPIPNPAGGWATLTRGTSDHQILAFEGRDLGSYDVAFGTGFHDCGWDINTLAAGWHHLTAIGKKDGNTYFYIDGTQKCSANFRSVDDIVSIGNYQYGQQPWGTFDEVKIYNRALSDAEVRYLYNGGGPVAQWKMDEGEGRTVYDSTENNNDGTLVLGGSATSSAWITGKFGTALNFDGVDDYVNCGSGASLNIINKLTLSAWIKTTKTANEIIIGKDYAKGYYLNSSSGSIRFWTNNTELYTESNLVADGIFHHVAAVFDNGKKYIYIDGILRASGTGTLISDTGPLYIGLSPVFSSYFSGTIDDVKIYNYARTAEQIRLDYNAGVATHFK
jgi:hypothetical protein